MSGDAETHDRISRLFSEALYLSVTSVDTDLFETGVLDSLAFVELLVQLEREFGLTIAPDDMSLENFRTIACIAAFVTTRTSHPAGPDVVRLQSRG